MIEQWKSYVLKLLQRSNAIERETDQKEGNAWLARIKLQHPEIWSELELEDTLLIKSKRAKELQHLKFN